MEAVRRFAGDDPGRAVPYPEDDQYLPRHETHADHYEHIPFGEQPGDSDPPSAA